VQSRLNRALLPELGKWPVRQITADIARPVLLAAAKQSPQLGRLAKQYLGAILRHSIAHGHAAVDVTAALRKLIKVQKSKHHSAWTADQLRKLFASLESEGCRREFAIFVELLARSALRSSELRCMEWSWINIDEAEVIIPAEAMKMGAAHVWYLSKQCIALLKQLRDLTGEGPLLFPCVKDSRQPSSISAFNKHLSRVGMKSEDDHANPHGLRGTARTWWTKVQRWPDEAIEFTMSHSERDPSRGAYQHHRFQKERRDMLQCWSDELDRILHGGSVVELKRKATA